MAGSIARPASRLEAGAFGQMFVRSPSRKVARELRRLVQDTEKGRKTSPLQKRAIFECVEKLQKCGEGTETTGPATSATWKLLWTTEKVNGHSKDPSQTVQDPGDAVYFGQLQVFQEIAWGRFSSDLTAVIDVENGRLQNTITFEPESRFDVDASIQVASPQRINFTFERAFYQEGDQKPFQLPPFGKGWFENVYVDDEIRVAKDIRQDTLICVRYGPPKFLSR